MNSKLVGHLNSVWIRGGASRRGEIGRIWPELAEALDMAMTGFPVRGPLAGMTVPEKQGQSCDGCRTIERLRLRVKPGDEEAFYQFQRAERKHRRECPNK